MKDTGQEALVLCTLYSPFMCAGQTRGRAVLARHIEEDGEAVRGAGNHHGKPPGLRPRVPKLGVDGFYTSTQGGEKRTFRDPAIFGKYIVPCDLRLMKEIDARAPSTSSTSATTRPRTPNSPPSSPTRATSSIAPRLTTGDVTLRDLARLFGRPIMGGMDRQGVINTGTDEEIRKAAKAVLSEAPGQFVLGADCTVPNARWEGLCTAIETAHAWRRG